MNEFVSSYYGELYHHGIKGMKWGVRRYQNADGSLTPAGKKRYYTNSAGDTSSQKKTSSADRNALAKKLADRDFSAVKKQEKLGEEFDKEQRRLEKELKRPKVWYDENGRMTKEASDYMDQFDKVYERFNRKELKLYKEQEKEESDLRKAVFLADDVKQSMLKARRLRVNIDNLYDESAGYKSKAYQDALETYSKKYTNEPDYNIDDIEYSFDHYYWPNSNERKQADKEYERKAAAMNKEYNDLVTNIGKKVTDGFGDQKMSDDSWFKNYEDWGRNEVDNIVRFNRLSL